MDVKASRRYDSSRRQAQARRTRDAILDAARRRLLTDGYARTAIATVADDASVSVETIYKAFGGKAGLLRAIWQRGLGGRGPIPAPARSDEMSAAEENPTEIIRRWSRLAIEVAPEVSPILLLVRAGAATDPILAELLEEANQERWDRMRHNAARLASAGGLRDGLSLDEATDVLWATSSPELYELLVVHRNWSLERYGQFVSGTIAAALLPDIG